jgi:WD40 repeat protein
MVQLPTVRQEARIPLTPPANVQPGPFISYAREDQPFVRQLYDGLMKRQRDPWVDWELLPAAEWMEEIRSRIDSAPAIVFVLSPDSIASPICAQELEHALIQHKRIIPVVCRDIDPEKVYESLRKLNWIYALDARQLNDKVDTLVAAMDVDLNWVHAHARLLVRAQEWESKGEDRSLLVRGSDLKESEEWLARIGDQQTPRPTALQAKYVLASRKAQTKRQRYTLAGVTSALLVTTGLAIYAMFQSRIATSQRNTALSRMLAAQSLTSATGVVSHLDVALLQSVAAYRIQPTAEAQHSLFNALLATNRVKRFVHTSDTLVSIDISPDGRTIATGEFHGQIVLWDAKTLQPKLSLEHGRAVIESVAFSPDGRMLASADLQRVILWDASSGTKVRALENHHGRIKKVAWHPDGATLITNGEGIVFWDVATGVERGAIEPGEGISVRRFALSPDGKTVASTGDYSRDVRLWDIASRKQRMLLSGHEGAVDALAFSPDGLLLASGGSDATIVIWDVASGRKRTVLTRHNDPVESVAFSPDGKSLVSGSRSSMIILWDLSNDEPREFLFGHTNGVFNIVFNRDAQEFVSTGFEGGFIVWNLGTPKHRALLTGHSEGVTAVAVSPDGGTIASASEDMTVRLWDAVAARERAVLKGHSDEVSAIAFNPTQGTLASAAGHSIFLWDTSNGRQLMEMDNEGNVTSIAFSPDGRSLASSVELARSVSVWDVATGQLRRKLVPSEGDDDIATLHFSRDGRMLVSGGGSTIRFWDPAAGVEIREPIQTETVSRLAISPDAQTVVSSSGFAPPFVVLWDLKSSKKYELDTGALTGSNAVAFSPDGRTVAYTSGEARLNIVLWDVASRRRVGVIDAPATVRSMVFTPGGKQLVTGLSSGRVAVWDVDVKNWPKRACEVANRNFTREEWRSFVGDELPYTPLCSALPVPKD